MTQTTLIDLSRLVLRHADVGYHHTIIPHLGLFVADHPTSLEAARYEPMICLVLQGSKRALFGNQELRYDSTRSLIAILDLPATCEITEATADKPFVSANLKLDRDTLASLAAEMPALPDDGSNAFALTPLTAEVLQSLGHLLALLDRPKDIKVLAPLRERELLYHLLQGPQGGIFRQVIREDSRLSQIRRATEWIKNHLDETLRVETLADIASMSVATFHRHFKAVTAVSPLQYQKMLRLQAARQLMVTGSDVRRAAYSVGYDSASQFSREYARMFGAPPSRHAGGAPPI